MKKIFSFLVLAFIVAFMVTACGSSNQVVPVLYELFDNYAYTTFPAGPWSSYNRTSQTSRPPITTETWTGANWSIVPHQVNLDAGVGLTQNSAFINNNYISSADCTAKALMTINTATATNGNLGVILRANDASFTHYAFIYYVADNTVDIQKVDAAGASSSLPVTSSTVLPTLNLTTPHNYSFSISGTSPATLNGHIDGVLYITVTDSGSVYTSGKVGFFLGNAHDGYVSRFFIWEP